MQKDCELAGDRDFGLPQTVALGKPHAQNQHHARGKGDRGVSKEQDAQEASCSKCWYRLLPYVTSLVVSGASRVSAIVPLLAASPCHRCDRPPTVTGRHGIV